MLPSELEGEPVTWMSVSGAVIPQAALMFIAAAALMWAGRYSGLKERLRKEAAEFEDQIEEVMTQLVLLLDAGLVVSAALDRIAAPEGRERGPLFRAMADIKEECDRSNASFIQSFYSYSITTGSRELIRFASLIRDGSLRGSGLSQKLSVESGRMHDSRLNRAKGKARALETRLCMPLMLLLISLLAIAAGPVLIGM
jgi:Flp pilus assembly protein TadB